MSNAPVDQMTTTDPFGLNVPVPTGGSTFGDVPWNPPIRMVRDPETGRFVEYGGPGIIASDGTIVRNDDGSAKLEYDLRTEPRLFYLTTPSTRLEAILDSLKAMGARTDTPEQAVSAIGDLMLFANNYGRDLDTTLRELQMRAPNLEEEKPRYRVSSSRDLRAVFNEAAKSTIGRGFSEEEMARAINAYQAGERGVQSVESGVVESMASPQVYGMDFARQVAPTEAQAFTYLGFMDRTMKKAASRVV